jgi:hypothetical protein
VSADAPENEFRRYTLSNLSDQPIQVLGYRECCGCRFAQAVPTTLPARGSAELIVRTNWSVYASEQLPAPDASIVLFFDHPKLARYELPMPPQNENPLTRPARKAPSR